MILFSCRRVAELTSQELDARLSRPERLCAAAHRLICPPCARYRTQLHEVDRVARELVREGVDAGDETLPSATKDHLRRQLGTPSADAVPPDSP